MDVNTQQQLRTAVRIWEVLQRRKEGEIIELDGQGLNIADVAAVAQLVYHYAPSSPSAWMSFSATS